MNLKEKQYFYFTQNSLSIFKSCPYRFEKKYIENIKWERENTGELKEKTDFGTDFHKIAERYFKGIPIYEESFINNENLDKAYKNLVKKFPIEKDCQYYPEYTIRLSDGFMRLEANMDLIILRQDGSVEIYDWKTNANLNNQKKYKSSLQTKVYMVVLKKCIKEIFNINPAPEKIKMTYFSPENACDIVSINYSEENYKKDEKEVKNLIKKVYNFNYDIFEREKYLKECKYCEFNLFCENQKRENKSEFAWEWSGIEAFY